jgi:DNA-binding response OmpR family regulator
VILTDYELGESSCGIDTAVAILRRWGMQVPVIILTGATNPRLQTEARDAGFHLLYKPLQPAKLRVLLQFILSTEGANAQEHA